MKTTISFTLDTERDSDVLRWLDSLPKRKRSQAIRTALRVALGGRQERITLADVYQAIMDLKRAGVVAAAPLSAHDEPADIAARLDDLGV